MNLGLMKNDSRDPAHEMQVTKNFKIYQEVTLEL